MDYFNIYGDNAYFELGKEAVNYLMNLDNPPDAILVMSAWTASGAYHALLNTGCKIPEDVSFLVYSSGEPSLSINPEIPILTCQVTPKGSFGSTGTTLDDTGTLVPRKDSTALPLS